MKSTFSARELQVIDLRFGNGLVHKEIEQKLNISVRCVKFHIERIYAKLGLSYEGGATAILAMHKLLAMGIITPRRIE